MKKILVPYDGSDSAMHAVQYAVSLAQQMTDVELHLLNVLSPVAGINDPPMSGHTDSQEKSDHAQRALKPAKDIVERAGIRHQTCYSIGSAASEIVEKARDKGCDAIIMGTRGMSPIASVMIGSVANQVVHLADVPVTLVK